LENCTRPASVKFFTLPTHHHPIHSESPNLSTAIATIVGDCQGVSCSSHLIALISNVDIVDRSSRKFLDSGGYSGALFTLRLIRHLFNVVLLDLYILFFDLWRNLDCIHKAKSSAIDSTSSIKQTIRVIIAAIARSHVP
jgi:hypothetical protein